MIRTPIPGISRLALVRAAGLAALLLAAAALRITGIAFDQPYVYYPDEYAIAKPAMGVVSTKDLNPHLRPYPAFLIYAETGIVGIVHTVTGASLDTSDPVGYGELPGASFSDFRTSQYPYLLWGRLLVVLMSVLTVLLLAIAGRAGVASPGRGKATAPPQSPETGAAAGTGTAANSRERDLGWLAGLVAAAFFAVAILPIDYSRYLATDVPAAFFATAACIAALASVSRPPGRSSDRLLILCGLFVGLGASTKYTAAAVAIVPVVAYMTRAGTLRSLPHWIRGAVRSNTPYLVALAAVLAFVLVTPMIIFDATTVIRGALSEILHYNVVGNPGAEGDSAGYYLSYLLNTGFGPVLSALVLAGIARALVRHTASDLVLVVFPITYFLLVSIPKVHFERNLMPLVPFAALLAGRFVADAAATLQVRIARRRRFLGSVAAAVLLAALLVQPALAAIGNAQIHNQPRTETVALDWVNEHLPSGSIIVREEYTPQVDADRYHVGYSWTLSSYDLSWYRSHGFRYAIVSSRLYARYLTSDYPMERSFYADLFALPTVYRVEPSSSVSGPTIVILDLQPGLAGSQADSP